MTSSAQSEKTLAARFDACFAAIGQGFNAYLERRLRSDEICCLNALGDAELLQTGLRRDRIPQYVFRDLFYI